MGNRLHLWFWAALAAVGILYASTLGLHGMFMWDEAEYACLARAIARGEPYSDALRPPVLPLSGSVALLLSGRASDSVLKVPVLVFALLGLGVVYLAMASRFDRATGLAALGLLAMAPAYWEHTTFFLTEIPLIVFFTAAIFLFHQGLYAGPASCLYASWVCVALGLLTRYTALLLGPIFLLFAALALVRGDRSALASKHFWLSPLAGLAVMAPWLARNQLVHQDALIGFKIASGQLQSYMPGVSLPWNFYLSGLPHLLGWPSILLLGLGIGWAIRSRDRLALHLLLVVGFLFLWFSLYRYKELRLITAALPFLACLAALGVTRALAGWVKVLARIEAIACLLVGLAVLTVPKVRPALQGQTGLGYPSFLEAMKELHQTARPEAVVMGSPTPHLSWYLDRKVVSVPGSEAELKQALKAVDWVVLVNWERGQPAYVAELFDRPPRLTLADLQQKGFRLFQDGQFMTLVMPSRALSERLDP